MAYSPVTIEPQQVLSFGFNYDTSVVGSPPGIAYIFVPDRFVSTQAKNMFVNAIDDDDIVVSPGWNYAVFGNHAVFTGDPDSDEGMLQKASVQGVDPQIVFRLKRGQAGGAEKVLLNIEPVGSGDTNVDLMVCTLQGDLFVSNDPDNADLQRWWAMFAIGRALGINQATDSADVMFPAFNEEAVFIDSATGFIPNIVVSECDIDALAFIYPGTSLTADGGVGCGGSPTPDNVPWPAEVTCSSDRDTYYDNESIQVDLHVEDTDGSDLVGALAEIVVVTENNNVFRNSGVTDSGGDVSVLVVAGGAFGFGDYVVTGTVRVSNSTIVGADKTLTIVG
jgi:hypothetical protein